VNIVPNTFVAFYNRGELSFGRITECIDNQYLVECGSDVPVLLNASRFVLVAQSQTSQTLEGFTGLVLEAKKGFAKHDFSFLKTDSISVEELSQHLQLSSDAQMFGLYDYLKSNPAIFHHKKDKFRLMTPAESQALNALKHSEETRKHFLTEIADFINGKELSPRTQHQLYTELPSALTERKSKDLMSKIQPAFPEISPENALIAFRKRCGELPGSIDPVLAASGLPIGFSSLLQQENLSEVATTHTTEIVAFCIDDEDTRDYDDAISLCREEDLWRFGIHVSCVAGRVAKDGLLMQEAERRVSSLYTANCVVPMFPSRFSETELSLINSASRACLSLYVWMDENYQIIRRDLRQDSIQVSENHSYREVDKNLAQEPFATLNRMCRKLETERTSASEGKDKRTYYYVKEQSGTLKLKQVNPNSPARKLVEELMILYNSSVAAYAREKGIPMIYRNVTQYNTAQEDFPASQAFLSTSAQFHPGIGTSAYLHASSPIRRWTDFVNQLQLSLSISSQPLFYSEEELQQMIKHVEKKLNYIKEVSHLSERYWWLKYLEQSSLNTPLDAAFRGAHQGRLRIELLKWGVQVLVKCDVYPSQEQFTIVVYKVDWEEQSLFGDIL